MNRVGLGMTTLAIAVGVVAATVALSATVPQITKAAQSMTGSSQNPGVAQCSGEGGTCKPQADCPSGKNLGDDLCPDRETGSGTQTMVCCQTQDLGGDVSGPGDGSGCSYDGGSANSDLSMEFNTKPPCSFAKGQTYPVEVVLKNTGSTDYNGVKFWMRLDHSDWSSSMPETSNQFDLPAGSSKTITLQYDVWDTLPDQREGVTVTFELVDLPAGEQIGDNFDEATVSLVDDPCASPSISYSPTLVSKGQTVQLNAHPDGCGPYTWDLNDGTTKSGQTVTHSYDSAGTYDVELTVTGEGGAAFSATEPVIISENLVPSIDEIVFKEAGSNDGDGEIDEGEKAEIIVHASDSDGSIANYYWSSSPDTGVEGCNSASCTTDTLSKADYTFTIEVEDDDGDSLTHTVSKLVGYTCQYECVPEGSSYCSVEHSGTCPSGDECCEIDTPFESN